MSPKTVQICITPFLSSLFLAMEPFLTQRRLQSLGHSSFPSRSLFHIPLEIEATGRARPARSLLSMGTLPAYAAAVFPFLSSVSFLLTSNIQFPAFSAPDILETSLGTTPKISFLGGDALVRAHHGATKVRTCFCVFALPLPAWSFLGCLTVPLLGERDLAAPHSLPLSVLP